MYNFLGDPTEKLSGLLTFQSKGGGPSVFDAKKLFTPLKLVAPYYLPMFLEHIHSTKFIMTPPKIIHDPPNRLIGVMYNLRISEDRPLRVQLIKADDLRGPVA